MREETDSGLLYHPKGLLYPHAEVLSTPPSGQVFDR
jgi:hypothetical protein